MTSWTKMTEHDAGFVEVLTTERSGAPYGYRLQGSSAGPQLVVAGACEVSAEVFDRILRIPTLPWMRGTLVLIKLHALDDLFTDLGRLNPLGPVDRTIMLPWSEMREANEFALRRNYHLILRACADLGMIAGRGVRQPIESGESK